MLRCFAIEYVSTSGLRGLRCLRLRPRMMKNKAAMMSMSPTSPTPTPIPIFAPDERPPPPLPSLGDEFWESDDEAGAWHV